MRIACMLSSICELKKRRRRWGSQKRVLSLQHTKHKKVEGRAEEREEHMKG